MTSMTNIPEFKLERSNRRSISIHITPVGDLVVKAPRLIPVFLINRFVSNHLKWIEKHLEKFKVNPTVRNKKYTEGEKYLYLGKEYPLHLGEYKEISVTSVLNFPKHLEFRIQKELLDWYLKQARLKITERVKYFSALMEAEYKEILFSDTRSKWGSCSRDNSLQFCWRLIMAPILVIDYVVVHELTHIFEKNHSDDFWRKVRRYKPAYKQYKKWLKDNAHRLQI
jgi:predicted metal-dependent hydrolase